MTSGKNTSADFAYDAILRDLLERTWPVDVRLQPSELAKRYGRPSGGMREALIRLAAKGFVANYPQRGFRTIKGTADTVRDHASHRIAIEVEAARLSIIHGDLTWEATLSAAYHGLMHLEAKLEDLKNPTPEELRIWTEAELTFHGALGSACGSEALIEAQLDAFIRFRIHLVSVDTDWGFRGAESMLEHKMILEAALDRDADACTKAIRIHFAHYPNKLSAENQITNRQREQREEVTP